jgi:hypothetical protein
MNRRRRRRNGGSNLRWRTDVLFQCQLRADDRTGGGSDDQRGVAKINLLLDQPSDQARLPSSSYGTAGSEYKRPRAVDAALFVPVVMIH